MTLREHLNPPTFKCVTIMSPQTQNKIMEIIGESVILKELVEEIKHAQFFGIMADDFTSHYVEELAFCVRFLDKKADS